MTSEISLDKLGQYTQELSHVRRYMDGSAEALVLSEGRSYPIAWTHSYGHSFVNPQVDEIPDLLSKTLELSPGISTLLVSLQSDDRCAANCLGCVFANDRNKGVGRKATPISSIEYIPMLNTAINSGEKIGIISPDQSIRVNPLLSGDPSYNSETSLLIAMTAAHPRIKASRWSTIASVTPHEVLNQFTEAARAVSEHHIDHKLRFQVSLHSTDPEERILHVSHYSPSRRINLYSTEEINSTFEKIYSYTGEASTLAFVVHEDSVIDPLALSKGFDQQYTWVSLRPLVKNDQDLSSLSQEKFVDLYSNIREQGFNVVVMPTVNGIEQDNLMK